MDVKKDVKTAGRTLSLFEAFYQRKAPMTLTQLAGALNASATDLFYEKDE